VLFTRNKRFRLSLGNTEKRRQKDAHLRRCLEESGIKSYRIVVLDDDGGSTTYVSESEDHVQKFFEIYDNVQGCTIFSDMGHGFINGLERYGFARHIFYTPLVHEFLSPNDNRFHGVKVGWRNDPTLDFSDDVRSCLDLMRRFDEVSGESIKGMFNRNFMLDQADVTVEAARAMMGKDGHKNTEFHRECLYEYRVAIGKDIRSNVPDTPRVWASICQVPTGHKFLTEFFFRFRNFFSKVTESVRRVSFDVTSGRDRGQVHLWQRKLRGLFCRSCRRNPPPGAVIKKKNPRMKGLLQFFSPANKDEYLNNLKRLEDSGRKEETHVEVAEFASGAQAQSAAAPPVLEDQWRWWTMRAWTSRRREERPSMAA